MNKFHPFKLFLVIGVLVLFSISGFSGVLEQSNRMLAQAKDYASAKRIADQYGYAMHTYATLSSRLSRWVGYFSHSSWRDQQQLVSAMELLRNQAEILSVSMDSIVSQSAMFPNDPGFGQQWPLHNTNNSDIDAPETWDYKTDSSDVIVATVDGGIDLTHEDLADNLWINAQEIAGNVLDDDSNGYVDDVHGFNAIDDSGVPAEGSGHGSHCAGIIGAVGNNSKGISGVCWRVKLMALKFLDDNGSGYTSDGVECLDYAAFMAQRGEPLKAVNCSFGSGTFTQEVKDAIDVLGGLGVMVTCSAGNSTQNNDVTPNYPASYDCANIIAVAATNANNSLLSYSNYGAVTVDLGAPGESVYSTYKGNAYILMSGTSMAAPHVAGAVAMTASLFPNDTVAERKARILDNTTPMDVLQGKCVTGGRLNLFNIIKNSGMLIPDFSFANTPYSTKVLFNDESNSSANIIGWQWDFGDGSTSTQQHPTHDYAQAGTYTVILTVTDDSRTSATVSKPVAVPGVYCLSKGNSAVNSFISLVEFADLSNSSVGNGYYDYTQTIAPANVQQGQTYTLAITQGKAYACWYKAYIDFNRDGDFSDEDEVIFCSAEPNAGPIDGGDITIPANAALGITRMRVQLMNKTNLSLPAPGPCDIFSFGDVEDYAITISGSCIVNSQGLAGSFPGLGVWARKSADGTWERFSKSEPDLVRMGDVNNNGKDDLACFYDEANELWLRYDDDSWQKIAANTTNLITFDLADMNGDGQADLIGSWTDGVWKRNAADASWEKVSNHSARLLAAADFDGDGLNDLLGLWENLGLWIRYSVSGNWQKIQTNYQMIMALAAGDTDGDGNDQIIGTWQGMGVWAYQPADNSWQKITASDSAVIAAGDLNADNLFDIAGIWFGNELWVRYSAGGSWERLSKMPANSLAIGKIY